MYNERLVKYLTDLSSDYNPTTEVEFSPKITNWVFEGGGIKGLGYVGALEKMVSRDSECISRVENVIGSSAGGIMALMLALDFSIKEIFQKSMAVKFDELLDEHSTWNAVLNLAKMENVGLHSGDKFLEYFQSLLIEKGLKKDITFREFDELRLGGRNFKTLTVTATNLRNIENPLQYFNAEITPDVKIAEAVRATMSFPMIIRPIYIKIGDTIGLFSDGGICNNYPFEFFDNKKFIQEGYDFTQDGHNPCTLGFKIDSTYEINSQRWNISNYTKLSSILPLIGSIKAILKSTINNAAKNSAGIITRTINIDSISGIGTMELDLSDENKQKLIEAGKEAVGNWYENYNTGILSIKTYQSIEDKYKSFEYKDLGREKFNLERSYMILKGDPQAIQRVSDFKQEIFAIKRINQRYKLVGEFNQMYLEEIFPGRDFDDLSLIETTMRLPDLMNANELFLMGIPTVDNEATGIHNEEIEKLEKDIEVLEGWLRKLHLILANESQEIGIEVSSKLLELSKSKYIEIMALTSKQQTLVDEIDNAIKMEDLYIQVLQDIQLSLENNIENKNKKVDDVLTNFIFNMDMYNIRQSASRLSPSQSNRLVGFINLYKQNPKNALQEVISERERYEKDVIPTFKREYDIANQSLKKIQVIERGAKKVYSNISNIPAGGALLSEMAVLEEQLDNLLKNSISLSLKGIVRVLTFFNAPDSLYFTESLKISKFAQDFKNEISSIRIKVDNEFNESNALDKDFTKKHELTINERFQSKKELFEKYGIFKVKSPEISFQNLQIALKNIESNSTKPTDQDIAYLNSNVYKLFLSNNDKFDNKIPYVLARLDSLQEKHKNDTIKYLIEELKAKGTKGYTNK